MLKFLPRILCAVGIAVTAACTLYFTEDVKAGLHLHGSSSSQTGGGILLNVSQPQYFSGYNPFLNWWKTASTIQIVSSSHGTLNDRAVWDNGTYLNTATGELKNPVPADVTSMARGVYGQVSYPSFQYEGTSFSFVGQQFDVTWSGCANPTPSVNNLGTGGTSSFGSNAGSFTLGTGANNVALTFSPNATGCTNNPPTNVKVYQHQYATNVANGELTNPDWRADVKPFSILRLMDLMHATASGVNDSSQLAGLSYAYYNGILDVAYALTGSSISGTVLTTSGEDGQAWQVGMKLVCAGCTNAMTIASFGTGTGGDGTYNLTCTPSCNTVSGVNILGIPPIGMSESAGPKSTIGPDIACAIANEVGIGIEYPIPMAASNQYVTDIVTALKACTTRVVKLSYANENWNFGFATFPYVGALGANTGGISGNQYSGYRAAQIFDIAQGIYGSNSGGGRWIGALGSFNGITGDTTDVIAGAKLAITNLGLHPFTQLVSQIDVAPYTGDFFGADAITNITAGASPTVTAANDNGAGSPALVNGQLIKLFVTGGTMAAALNNQYATVSSATTTSFVININTTGLTYGGAASDIAADATFFKLADQSATLNGSTPATYPTKFSYFTQQLSKAILNKTATDPSYGTITIGGNLSGGTGSLQDLLTQHALIANSNGIAIGQYEGGNAVSMAGSLAAFPPNQLIEYFINWQFDNGVVGDSTNTEGGIETAVYNASCSLSTNYAGLMAQYTEAAPQSQFGPWGALRFFPGDESNIKWSTLAAKNALGPCVDPTPAATGTYNFIIADDQPGGSNAETFSANIGTASTYAIVGIFSQNGRVASSVTIDGTTLNLDVQANSSNPEIYSGVVPVGAASRTVTINWVASSSLARGAYVWTASNLLTQALKTSAIGASTATISETKNSLQIAIGNCTGTANYNNSTTTPTGTNQATFFGSMAYWTSIAFSTTIYSINTGGAGCNLAAATYR